MFVDTQAVPLRRRHRTRFGGLGKALGMALGLVLSGCASYGPPRVAPGAPVADVVAVMGEPTGRHADPTGQAATTRWEFARGPFGRHTYMVDVDAQGRVVGWRQVLDEKTFATIMPGMTTRDVLYQLGRPSNVRRIERQRMDVWAYRYETYFCQWFQVSLGDDGRVIDGTYGVDPICDKGDDRLPF